MLQMWKFKICCIFSMVSVSTADYSELKLWITMKSPIFNMDLLNTMISEYLNSSSILLDNPKISLSNDRAGVVNVTIWFGEMSDKKQIEFYKYMENIYPTALNENFNISNVLVLCNDCCMSDTTREDAFKGKYRFNTTLVNTTTFILCRYNADQNKYASRFCSLNSLKEVYWEDANFNNCEPKSNATKQLILLSQIPTCDGAETNNSCLSPDDKILKLNEVKKSPSLFATHEDIVLVATILKDIFMNSSTKLKIMADIFDTINRILSISPSLITQAQISNNSSRKILTILSALANQSVEEVRNLTSQYKTFSFKYLALTLSRATFGDTLIQTYSLTENNTSVNIMDTISTCNQNRVDWNASVFIPSDTLNHNNFLFSFVFKKPSFFLSKNGKVSLHFNQGGVRQNSSGVIVSSVISATVFNYSITSLKNPIKLSFKNIDQKNMNGYLDCYYWNITLDSWSKDGCRKVFENSFEVVCECDHLTNFALVLDTSQRGYNPLTLQIVTWVGSVISLGSLFLSILALILFRKWFRHLSLNILLQLCISLMALVAIFIAGAERRSMHLISCRVVAGLLQYFILATFLWTGVEALSLYKNFVTVFHDMDPIKFMRISSQVAWGVPLLVVAISAGSARDSFGNCDLCLLRGKAFYFGVLTPVSVILVSNFIILVLVMISLSTQRVEKFVANKEKTRRYRRILRSSRIAFAFSSLLGLTWLFAIVAIGEAMKTFQWLFCIFNSLQGLFLFVQYIVRNHDLQVQVRSLWKSLSIKRRKKRACYSFTNDAFTYSTNESSVASIDSSNVELKRVSNLGST